MRYYLCQQGGEVAAATSDEKIMSKNTPAMIAANDLSKEGNTDVMIINGDIDSRLQDLVIHAIKNRKSKQKSLTFILATPGGSAESAYRISRVFQDSYEHVAALVAGWCKSAGTLCVIGAKEIIMTDEGELGPLDVQIVRRDELGELDSGLVISEALANIEQYAFSLFENFMMNIKTRSHGTITFKTATEISIQITAGLFESIYKQIDPQKIGETARSLAIAEAYGTRLNLWAKNLQGGAIKNLTVGYPTHGFVIDRREAESLFKRVRGPNDKEIVLIGTIGAIAMQPVRDHPVVEYLNTEESVRGTDSKNKSVQSASAKDDQEKATPATGTSGRTRKSMRDSAKRTAAA